ncbi:MAG: glycosyltransferase family 2 protein, partial [Planctomycetaceae bacterium]
EAVRARFPEVRVFSSREQAGYLVWRNQGFRDASGEFVVSIDDDSYFTVPDTVTRIVEEFDEFPRAAALALPYYEPRSDRSTGFMRSQRPGTRLRSYVGCAHAVRRRVFLEFGGYRELLTHQGEERDLCLRLIDGGWDIVYADTPPLVHLYSPHRDRDRVNFYGYRNTLLFSGLNVPQPYLLPRMLIDTVQLLRYRFTWKSLPVKLRALTAGWSASWRFRAERAPVSRAAYRVFRSLPGHGPVEPSCVGLPEPLRQETSAVCWKS